MNINFLPLIIVLVCCTISIIITLNLVCKFIGLIQDALIAIWKVLVKIELQYEANNKKEE